MLTWLISPGYRKAIVSAAHFQILTSRRVPSSPTECSLPKPHRLEQQSKAHVFLTTNKSSEPRSHLRMSPIPKSFTHMWRSEMNAPDFSRDATPCCNPKQILSSNLSRVGIVRVNDWHEKEISMLFFLSPRLTVSLSSPRGRLHRPANRSNRILSSYPYCADTPWWENRGLPRWNQVTNITRKTERETVW